MVFWERNLLHRGLLARFLPLGGFLTCLMVFWGAQPAPVSAACSLCVLLGGFLTCLMVFCGVQPAPASAAHSRYVLGGLLGLSQGPLGSATRSYEHRMLALCPWGAS